MDLALGFRDRSGEISNLKSLARKTEGAVAALEHDLAADEDGDLDYRTKLRFDKAVDEVRETLDDSISYAEGIIDQFEKSLEEVDRLTDMLTDVLKLTGCVVITADHDEVREWCRSNLNGDWDYLPYEQKQYKPTRLKHIYIITDEVDRVNFKLRWA